MILIHSLWADNADSRVTTMTDPRGNSVTYTYDAEGQMTAKTGKSPTLMTKRVGGPVRLGWRHRPPTRLLPPTTRRVS